MEPKDFVDLIKRNTSDVIVEDIYLSNRNAAHVSEQEIKYIEDIISEYFCVPATSVVSAYVVGSAKLGFSIIEKLDRNGNVIKPAYRDYDPRSSDIDVAIVNPVVYGKIWSDLSRYGYSSGFPWRGDRLADYMLHGWIRPDKFPTPLPLQCELWDQVYRKLCTSQYFRFKKLRCGIYHSKAFLKSYQIRSVEHAKLREINADL